MLRSPANTLPGPDRDQYPVKRRRLLASGAHLVEIDLLRDGPRLPMEGLPAMVSRTEERRRVGASPLSPEDEAWACRLVATIGEMP